MHPEKIYQIHSVPIETLIPNPSNPRMISDVKFQLLCESIKRDTWMLQLRPIVINSDGVILGGNQRYKACKRLEMENVWVINADSLTSEEQRRFILRDNVDFGKWDAQLIRAQYTEAEINLFGIKIDLLDETSSSHETFSSRPPLLPDEDMEPDIPMDQINSGAGGFAQNSIKQISFNFPKELCEEVLKDLDCISRETDCDDNSEVLLRLINFYEMHNGLQHSDNNTI